MTLTQHGQLQLRGVYTRGFLPCLLLSPRDCILGILLLAGLCTFNEELRGAECKETRSEYRVRPEVFCKFHSRHTVKIGDKIFGVRSGKPGYRRVVLSLRDRYCEKLDEDQI